MDLESESVEIPSSDLRYAFNICTTIVKWAVPATQSATLGAPRIPLDLSPMLKAVLHGHNRATRMRISLGERTCAPTESMNELFCCEQCRNTLPEQHSSAIIYQAET